MLSLAAALVLAAAPLQDTAHVVLVATTDVHGHATDWDYVADRPFAGGVGAGGGRGGLAPRAYPGQVLVVDAGDLLQGDPFATYYARVAPTRRIRSSRPSTSRATTRPRRATTTSTGASRSFSRPSPSARFPYVSANLYAGRGDSLLFPRVARRAAAGRPHRDHRPHDARDDGLGPRTAGAGRGSRRSPGGRRRCSRRCAATPTSPSRWCTRASTAARPTTPPAWATRTSPPALATLPARPDVVVVGHSHREMRDSVIAGVHFVQPRPFGASVSVVHLDLAREATASGACTGSARTWSPPATSRRLGAAGPAARRRAGRGPRLGPDGDRARVGADARDRRAGRPRAGTRLHPGRPAPAHRRAALGRVRLRSPGGVRRRHHPRGARARALSLRQYAARRPPERRPAQGVPRVERAVLPGGPGGPDRAQRLGARATTTTSSPAPSYDIDLRRPWATGSSACACAGGRSQPADSFTMAINSYRQTGGGGYDMLRGAPVVYDKGERIAELLIDAVRARSPLDPARVRAAAELAHRARGGRPRGPRAVRRPGPAAAQGRARHRRCSGCSPPATSTAASCRAPARSPARSTAWAPTAAAPQLRLDAGDAMQGTPVQDETRGRAGMELLGRLGYAAAALGDHDFDWSPRCSGSA